MWRRSKAGFVLLATVLPTVLACPAVARSAERVAVQWRFATEGDFLGWTPGGHIADATVSDGALRGKTVDWDPILTGPVFGLEATPTQRVQIKMKTAAGQAQLFWTETTEGKYGGFSQEKSGAFHTHGDGRFHVYSVDPFWHAAGKIVRLRLDPPDAGEFAVEWIRIVDEDSVPRSQARRWTFDADPNGWRPLEQVADPVVQDGCLLVTALGQAPVIISPLLSVSADENSFVSIRMAATGGASGRVLCVSSTQFGSEATTFPLRADGEMHSYNVDVGHLKTWRDRIVLIGVQPTDAQGAVARIESIGIGDRPCGPPELAVSYFGQTDGINRAGRPAGVASTVQNLGGEAAQEVVATLKVARGGRTIGQTRQKIGTVSRYLAKTATWLIESPSPGEIDVSVELESAGCEPISAAATLRFTEPPRVPGTSYVPEPEPVAGDYQIGVFYFPGWHSMSRWQPILDYPSRKPVLGWYDEANPECADWQIKWAVEHGVTFFMVDWYWSEGSRQLEHWLHDAYMKARYRKYLKWAVMWANHNRPGTHSLDDWRNVTRYWIDRYFGMEEYYHIDGRPAVFIWSPQNVRRDLGGSQEAAKPYALSQQMARDAGYPGIYFVAMSSHEGAGQCNQLKAEGYDAFTSYHGFKLARQGGGNRSVRFPYADVVRTGPQLWQLEDARAAGMLYMPIVDTGWSSEPWHRSEAMVVSGRTPELFGKLCRQARAYADKTGKKIITLGPWNEWGEGSYIEPYAEHGFEDLDQLRDAFCPAGDFPPNLVPADLGLGPYDLPPIEPKTSWEFDTSGELEGWTPNGQLTVQVAGGLLAGRSKGDDPILQGPAIQVEADRYKRIWIRFRTSANDRVQLFWSTTEFKASEKSSVSFDVVGDGQFHDYEIELANCPAWRGLAVSLRLDPASRPGVEFAIDRIAIR